MNKKQKISGKVYLTVLAALLCAFFTAGCENISFDPLSLFPDGQGQTASHTEPDSDEDNLPTIVYNTEENAGEDGGDQLLSSLIQRLDEAFQTTPYDTYEIPDGFFEWMGPAYGAGCLQEFADALDNGTFTPDSFYELTHNTYLVLQNQYEDSLRSSEEAGEQAVHTREAADASTTVLAFGGDVCLDDRYSNMAALRSRENGIYDSISEELMQELTGADILMLNNEFPYSDRGAPTPEKQFTFRAAPENVEILTQMGADLVSLANNHAYDYGPEALLDTFETLKGAGIPYVGAGRDLSEAMKPVYFIVNGRMLAYVSATQIERNAVPDTKEATETTPGVLRTQDTEKFLSVIEEARQNSDFVIAYVHWGSENVNTPEQSQREMAVQYEEAGADLILGDHPHVLQGFEFINDTPVIYSLGNFWFNSKTGDTCLLKIMLDEQGALSVQMLPCLMQNSQTLLADGAEKERILRYTESISYGVVIDSEGFVTPVS